jgi:hypothetical protein
MIVPDHGPGVDTPARPQRAADSPSSTLDTWLGYAQLGIPIVPEHTPDPAAVAGCDCRREDCGKPGKHPRTTNGSDDATTVEKTLRRWHTMWPHANVGTSLEMAGLVIIGPDSPEWHEEFKRRGLHDGPVAQSGGGEGHLHYYRRLPEGVPATRICKSGEYDILAKGNAILSPSLHASGRRYEWLVPITSLEEIPYLEEWACEMLRAAGARRERTAITREDSDGPPVELDDFERQIYDGELPKLTPDGDVDRSGTLLKIGRVLYDAGAKRRLIVDELAELDAARYQKYSTRGDASEQYNAIVDELERTGRNPRFQLQGRNGPLLVLDGKTEVATCRGCTERDATICTITQQLKTYRAAEHLVRAGTVPAAEALVLEQLTKIRAYAQSKGDTLASIYVPEIARTAGVGDTTVTRAFNQVRRWQADPELSERLPFRIEDHGEGRKSHLRLRVVPLPDEAVGERSRTGALVALGQMPRDEGRQKHGGERISCPSHPEAAVIRTRQWRCTEDDCTWVQQDTARIEPKPDQDGPVKTSTIYGAKFFEELRATVATPDQDGPLSNTDSPDQDGPGEASPPPVAGSVSFVTRDMMEAAAGQRLRLVPDDSPPGPQQQWRCPCGSFERHPRTGGAYRCDGCGDVELPAMKGATE